MDTHKYICFRVNITIYGTLKAALLFWKKPSSSLKQRNFIINPYNWCVANKDINGTQCTIIWHVDDLTISHKDSAMVNEVIASLSNEYGKVGEMRVKRGKIHEYLGMTLDFSEESKFIINMEEYTDNILIGLPEDMNGVTTTPVADHLFKTLSDAPKLNKERAELFHRVTAQSLFLAQHDRPDLRTVISFLTKQVGRQNRRG